MRQSTSRWHRIAILSLCLLGNADSLRADGVPGALPPDALAGQVVDPSGKPAAGAKVWLVGGEYDKDAKTLSQTVADAQGRFVIREAQRHIQPKARTPSLVVGDSQGRMGWNQYPWNWVRQGKWTPQQSLRIKLVAVREYRGRLVDSAGQPIAKAVICPQFVIPDIPDAEHYTGIELPRELANELACETGADGAFVLRRVPAVHMIEARVTASGFGSPQVRWQLKEPLTVRLDRAGGIRGTVSAPARAAALDTLKLSLYRDSDREKAKAPAFRISYHAAAFPGEDGKFRFDNVPPGGYTIRPNIEESSLPYYAKELAPFDLKPGAAAAVEIKLLPAVAVRGQVVDAANGRGIQGISISAAHLSDKGQPTSWRQATSDTDGRFVVHCEPGKVAVKAEGGNDDYLFPILRSDSLKIDATADVACPTIKLQRAARLEGIAVDEAGKPVPGAEVQSLTLCHGMPNEGSLIADAGGRFSIQGLDAKQTLSLRARSATGVSNTQDVRPADVSAPVRLVLSPQNAVAVKGLCLDQSGRPVVGAEVSVSSTWMLGPMGVGLGVGQVATDSDGRFNVAPLWPGFNYDATVSADGFAKYRSMSITAKPGQSPDFGKIVLVDQRGFVEGTVVDSAGRPIAGARVFTHREAAAALSATTDDAGRFRVQGLRPGRVFLFAEKDGYRLKAVTTVSRTTGLSVALLRAGEPVPPWKPRRPPASFAEEQQVARRLLDKLYAVPKKGPRCWSYRFMTRLDPSRALDWGDKRGGRFKQEVRRMAAEKIADDDVEEAIALLAPLDSLTAFYAFESLVKRCAASDAAKAERLAEEAVLAARRLDQPDRAVALARAGRMVGLLGKAEAGRKLIEEAAGAAAKMAPHGRSAFYRGLVAAALAPHDFDRAMALAEPLDAEHKDDAVAAIAVAIGCRDLEKALKVVSRLNTSSTLPDNTRLKIAYRLAATRPQDALRVVESMNTFGAKKIQADAYGQLAVVIAPRDRRLAWSLVDKSFAIYETNAQEMRGWSYYGGPGAFAAHVVTLAHRIGYPDMGLLIDRAVAMHPADDEDRPRESQRSATFIAGMLALVDPETGKELLETVAPRCDALKDFGYPGVEATAWHQAWALADLAQLTSVWDRRLEAARTNPRIDPAANGLDGTLDLLTTPQADRIYVLDRYVRAFSRPDQED
jgi:hypothetical protein